MIGMAVCAPSRTELRLSLEPLARVHGLKARNLTKELQMLLLEELGHRQRVESLRSALDNLSCPEQPGEGENMRSSYPGELGRWRGDHKLFSWLLIEEDLCHHHAPDTPFGEQLPLPGPDYWLSAPGNEPQDFLAGGSSAIRRRRGGRR